MFEGLRNMGSLAGMMKDLPRMKAKLEEVKGRLGEIEVEAQTGGGAVTVVSNCKLRIVSIQVDQSMMAGLSGPDVAEDKAIAEELIAGAVNAALEKAQERAARELSEAAEELGLPIPADGLQGLL